MEEYLDPFGAAPAAFSDAERSTFDKLVRMGGEVGEHALATNIANAKALIVIGRNDAVKGIAALKRPQASYRNRIGKSAKADLEETDYPYELGYIFILPDERGKKLSHRLITEALRHAEGAGVFATVRADNQAMLTPLAKAGFTAAGQEYAGRDKRTIRLLVRPRQAS